MLGCRLYQLTIGGCGRLIATTATISVMSIATATRTTITPTILMALRSDSLKTDKVTNDGEISS